MLSQSHRVLFVRYLFFGLIAYEMTKLPFFVLNCTHASCDYHPMPQFLSGTDPLKSPRYWLFPHQIVSMIIATLVGLLILGYDIHFKILLFFHTIFVLFIILNPFTLGNFEWWQALGINTFLVGLLSYLLYKRKIFAYLVILSVPIWVFDTIGFLTFAYNQIAHKMDSKYLIFLYNVFTRDEGFGQAPTVLKIWILIAGSATFVYTGYLFVTIPDKSQPKEE